MEYDDKGMTEAMAINDGIDAARIGGKSRFTGRFLGRFNILDNPFKSRKNKKLSVAWHNAFRAECIKIGRFVR